MNITKIIEWDMGHRIPNHKSKCKNLHGHRYKLEICLEGDLVDKKGASSEAMVMDFGDVKKIATSEICDLCDHSFMVWQGDKEILDFLKKSRSLKYVVVSFIPTAEEIAKWIFKKLEEKYQDEHKTGLQLHSVKLWETPTSSALYTREDFLRNDVQQ